MKITITSRRTGIFDVCPVCNVIADNKLIGELQPGKSLSFHLEDNQTHNIYCSYDYGKNGEEKSNIIQINTTKDYNLMLGVVYSKTCWGRFRENIRALQSKGYINVPDIELYEK